VTFALAWPTLGGAEDYNASSYQVKAAFILNFANLTVWPDHVFQDSTTPFAICLAGTDDTREIFETQYDGLLIANRPVEIRRTSKPDELSGCHVVMITADAIDRLEEFLDAINGSSILTVGETEGFAHKGGIIGFYNEGTRVRFEINQSAAQRAQLRISSRVLRLARLVSGEEK
jgi:hypothetical protein